MTDAEAAAIYQRVATLEARLERCPERVKRIEDIETAMDSLSTRITRAEGVAQANTESLKSLLSLVRWFCITFGGGICLLFVRALWGVVAVGGM